MGTGADPAKLPHLLRLLGDRSSVVRQSLIEQFAAFGPSLGEELEKLPLPPSSRQREEIQMLLEDQRRARLSEAWLSWRRVDGERERLERGLAILGDYQTGLILPVTLEESLDRLARECDASDAESLARYLFRTKGIEGAEESYDDPNNSSLIWTMEHRVGLPITLVTIFILVGRRLGIDIEGCNYPGHFLARFEQNGRTRFFDCTRGGRFLTEAELTRPGAGEKLREVLKVRATAEMILARVLRNLVGAYTQAGRHEVSRFMLGLLNDLLPRRDSSAQIGRYRVGQLVVHKVYQYRGVVVDSDPKCQASEEWYRSNRTQPERGQPWYHVLVDGTRQVTYSAQSNLQPDESDKKIEHPLVPYFFSRFENGAYIRNNLPWPKE